MNTNGVFSKKTDEWATPKDLFEKLNKIFGFDLDPCCTHENALCTEHYTVEENGLMQSWEGKHVFCNPPYSNVREWIEKASKERAFTVMLVPARTDTKWFHEIVLAEKRQIIFIKGRLKFGGVKTGAPFPSILIVFNNIIKRGGE